MAEFKRDGSEYRSVTNHLMAAGLGSAIEVASRPSFGMATQFRFTHDDGTVTVDTMRAIVALEMAGADPSIARYERYWPETDTWQLRWTRESGLI